MHIVKVISGLATLDKGEGVPVLFLHGYLSSKESFIFQTEYFSNYFRVIAFDFSGFGESEPLQYPYSLDDYVSKVRSLIDSLGLDRFHVIAHSFGARVAIKLALCDSRVDKLVLTGAAGLKPKRTLTYYYKVYSYKLLKKFLSPKRLEKFGSSEYKTLSPIMKKSYVLIVNEHLDKLARNVQNETLIIHGENDRETPLYMAKKYKKLIKNSTLKVLKGCGHFAFIDDDFDFNLTALNFLSGEEDVKF
ncbi:MAG: alpha/beta hydrolase [Clostridia bacterium]|nr:alpha/beta hydrolase [Clostridia bacterium]